MDKCFEGWSKADGNNGGRCCCNCQWQRTISGHPWNKVVEFRGRVSDVIAYGCAVPDMSHITLMDRKHGMCEMHEYIMEAQ